MWTFNPIVGALVMNFGDFIRVSVQSCATVMFACFVGEQGVVVPGSFPKFVADLQVFFGEIIAVTVLCEFGTPVVAVRVF